MESFRHLVGTGKMIPILLDAYTSRCTEELVQADRIFPHLDHQLIIFYSENLDRSHPNIARRNLYVGIVHLITHALRKV